MTRSAVRVMLLALLLISRPSPASADPPGPTDYQSRVVEVNPESNAIEVRIIGGDSFFEMTVSAGHDATVIGYRGEPYLRFDPDGLVYENRLSPTKYLNEERYGTYLGPAEVDPKAEPIWDQVAEHGSYAWHDHRTHWMNDKAPVGVEPGDQILEAVVPVVLDGGSVEIVVVSHLVASPSPLAAIVGAVAGLAAAALLVRSRSYMPLGLAIVGTLALALGAVATLSVPPETGPSILGWLLPAATIGFAGVGWLLTKKGDGLTASAVLLAGFVELGLWVWLRKAGLWSAIIPTEAPFWLDRGITAAILAMLAGGILATSSRLLKPI